MEWLAGKPDAALQVILRSVQEGQATAVGGVALLRAKRSLEETFKLGESMPWKEREGWVKLRGLLDLLTSSSSSPAAAALSSTFDGYLLVADRGGEFAVEGTAAHESLTVASLMMLYHHGTTLRNPTPPSLLRERVEKAIEVYPSNSVVLGIFLEAEKGQGVWGRVRGCWERLRRMGWGRRRMCRGGWRRSGWRGGRRGGGRLRKERTRGGLAAAVENERFVCGSHFRCMTYLAFFFRTRGSPIIRRVFLEFEIQMGELQRAKKMLYRAIGESPLAKGCATVCATL